MTSTSTSTTTTANCGSHACDCRTVRDRPTGAGVRLHAERRHVAVQVGVLLEDADGMTITGEDWPDRLEGLLARLTFSERAALLAVPLDDDAGEPALPAEDVLARARTPWLPELLGGGGLFPHLQPIVSLADGATYGHESLLRAQLGERLLSGGEICAAARAHRAIFALDLAGRTVAIEHGFTKLDADQTLFVNFTPTAIYDPAVCLRTTWAIARRLGVSLQRVCFEVVESEAFPDIAFLQRILQEYRDHGAMIALDDLGAGHSSLTYLDRLRPDIVKLDRQLVTGIDGDGARRRLVGALVDYAHELGIRVVAEGIETEGELAVVRGLGVDLGQGYYLARPAADPVTVDPARVLGAREPIAA